MRGVLALVLVLASCGGDDAEVEAPADFGAPETDGTFVGPGGGPNYPGSRPPGAPPGDDLGVVLDGQMPEPDRGDPGPDDQGLDPPPEPDVGPPPEPDAGPRPDAGDPALPPGDHMDNVGYIGASCAADTDCDYAESFCLEAAEGYPNGLCSLDCERLCPDRDGASFTFCVGDVVAGSGACVQQCDYERFERGCRPGYGCRALGRFNDPATRRQVCLPGEDPAPPGDVACGRDLNERGVNYVPTDSPEDHPEGRADLTCHIEGPVIVRSPIRGVSYRYSSDDAAGPMFVSCHLAVALDELSIYLAELGVIEVEHIGTYNCRVIAGSDELSQHGLATAIDLAAFTTSDGDYYSLVGHWEHDTEDPQTPEGRWLYELAHQMLARGIFNIVLTPNFNAAHDNHFHVDLTAGANFLGSTGTRTRVIGPNHSGD